MDKPSDSSNSKVKFFPALFICLNCSLGASVFGVPWGFTQIGWVLALVISIVGYIFLSAIGMIFLQIISRMDTLRKYEYQGYAISPVPLMDFFRNNPPSTYLKFLNEDSDNIPLIPLPVAEEQTIIKHDLISICRTILGADMEKAITIVISFTSVVFLLGCTITFASSLVSLVPLGPFETCNIFTNPSFSDDCRYKYMFFILIFTVITIVTSMLFKFTEQQGYLIGVCIARSIVLILMSVSCLVLIANNKDIDSADELDVDLPLANKEGFGIAVPIILLSMGFHVLIPDMIHSLEDKEKKAVKLINWTLAIAFILLVFLGFCCVFGLNKPEPLITLNWMEYSNGQDLSERRWWHYMIGGVIGVYPALDVTSVFCVYIVNLADNINGLRKKSIKNNEDDTLVVFRIRGILLAITLLLPIYIYDLGIIFALAGCINLIVLMFFLPAIAIGSMILVPEPCCYDNFLASRNLLVILFMFGTVFLVFLWANFIGYFFY